MSTAIDSTIALVSSTDMNVYLGINTTGGTSTEEIESDRMNNAAGRLALSWTARSALVLSSALVEYYQGDDSGYIETRAYPITGVTQLWVDPTGAFTGTTGTVYTAADYQIDADLGRVFLLGGLYSSGLWRSNSIKLTYSAGYSTVPYDLQQAAKELVAFWYYRSVDKRVGMSSQTAGDTSKSYERDIPQAVAAVFDRYKNKAAMIA